MDGMSGKMTGMGTSGKITFRGGGWSLDEGSNATFNEIVNGKIVHPITCGELSNGKPIMCSPDTQRDVAYGSGGWTSDGHTLVLSFNTYGVSSLNFTTVSSNHMELKDSKGDIIHLMRNITSWSCHNDECKSDGWKPIPIHKHGISNTKLTGAPYLQSPGNSSSNNSTDGGRCVENTCQVSITVPIKQVTVFCQPGVSKL